MNIKSHAFRVIVYVLNIYGLIAASSSARAQAAVTPVLSGASSSNSALLQASARAPRLLLYPELSRPMELLELIDSVKLSAQRSEGLLVSSGTERGFIHAALILANARNLNVPAFTGLLIADARPENVLFSRINIALIKLSQGDRDTYVSYRFRATLERWQLALSHCARSSGLGLMAPKCGLTPEEVALLSDGAIWSWWKTYVMDRLFQEPFYGEPGRHGANVSSSRFKDANYIHSDRLFKAIWQLANQGNAQGEQVDLTDSGQRTTLIDAISKSGKSVALWDVSDSWQFTKVEDQLSGIFSAITSVGTPQGLVLAGFLPKQRAARPARRAFSDTQPSIYRGFGPSPRLDYRLIPFSELPKWTEAKASERRSGPVDVMTLTGLPLLNSLAISACANWVEPSNGR